MDPGSQTPGSPLRVVSTKWGGRPHWEYDALWLGQDDHGTWAGVAAGTVITRPGATVVADQLQVILLPVASWFVARFYDAAGRVPCLVYVDITTVPEVSGRLATSVDLDLDVVLDLSGRVRVEDEAEFAEHSAAWGYPASVVSAAVGSCASARKALGSRRAPFDGTHRGWLDRLAAVTSAG